MLTSLAHSNVNMTRPSLMPHGVREQMGIHITETGKPATS